MIKKMGREPDLDCPACGPVWLVEKEEVLQEGKFEVSHYDYHYGKYKNLISSSGIKHLRKSALHFKTWQDEPPKENEKEHFSFGQAYHIYILERERFEEGVAIAPDVNKRTKDGKAELEAFNLANADKAIISNVELQALRAMGKALKQSSFAADLLRNPLECEQTYIWQHPDYGFWCKMRLDFEVMNRIQCVGAAPPGIIGDLKSTKNAHPFGFPREVANFGYDIQAAWYSWGYRSVTKRALQAFIFLAQEKTPPYAVSVFHCGPDVMMRAWDKIDPALHTYAECLETGEYPGYPDELINLVMPGWA